MKKLTKNVLAAGLVLGLACTSLTGCTPSEDAAMMKVGNNTLTYAEANFYARYFQAEYEMYAGYMGQSPETMWSQNISEDQTLEESVKAQLHDSLEEMMLTDLYAAENGVALTEEELQNISDTADTFLAANNEQTLEVMTADKDSVSRVLELMMIRTRMEDKLVENVDTEVSDEEALQKSMSYVSVGSIETYNTENAEGETDDVMDTVMDVMESSTEEMAVSLADQLKQADSVEKFEEIAKGLGYTPSTVSYDNDANAEPCKVFCEAMWDLKKDGISEPVLDEETGNYYVGYQVSESDADATEARKTAIVNERKADALEAALDEMRGKTAPKWSGRLWDKIDFMKQGCISAEAETETEVTAETSAEANTDTSLTVENGDTVKIAFEGSIDGVVFEGGSSDGMDLEIGSGSFIDDFEEQLIGAHPGDSVDVNVTFPEDYGKEELNGKDALFKVDILGIYK